MIAQPPGKHLLSIPSQKKEKNRGKRLTIFVCRTQTHYTTFSVWLRGHDQLAQSFLFAAGMPSRCHHMDNWAKKKSMATRATEHELAPLA